MASAGSVLIDLVVLLPLVYFALRFVFLIWLHPISIETETIIPQSNDNSNSYQFGVIDAAMFLSMED